MTALAAATGAAWVAVAAVAVAAVAVVPAAAAGPGSAAPAAAGVCAAPARTANRHATAKTTTVYRYLLSLTCGRARVDGVVSGQNVGHGSQAADTSGLLGYPRLVAQLAQQAGHYVGVAGVDYEHDFIFTPAQLSVANQVLLGHARRGGLVTINWSPQSPWLNDESDIAGNPGVWTNTRTDNGQLDGVHLADLLDPATPAGQVWQRKLTRVADALTELRNAGVVVLWRPMQEMNGFWFWWGTTLQRDSASSYVRLWRTMFQYFTQVRHLNNLLWVYSPSAYPPNPADQIASNIRSAAWSYPGSDYVDVLAGTSYNDDLVIPNYQDYLRLPEVIGEAEYDEGLLGAHDRAGDLDTTLYATRLRQDYPAVAYWVSWHDFPWSDTETAHLALTSNLRATDLLNDPYVINADSIPR
jgi:mannan endo-1,4-beta-mannosidase